MIENTYIFRKQYNTDGGNIGNLFECFIVDADEDFY